MFTYFSRRKKNQQPKPQGRRRLTMLLLFLKAHNNSLLPLEALFPRLQMRARPAASVVSGGGTPNIDFICHSSAHPYNLYYNVARLSTQSPREWSLLLFWGEKKCPTTLGKMGNWVCVCVCALRVVYLPDSGIMALPSGQALCLRRVALFLLLFTLAGTC